MMFANDFYKILTYSVPLHYLWLAEPGGEFLPLLLDTRLFTGLPTPCDLASSPGSTG